MNWLILPIITIIIISLLRIRCMRQIFSYTKNKAFITTSITSIISVVCITLLYYFKHHLHITHNTYLYIYIGAMIVGSSIYYRRHRLWWWILQSLLWIGITLSWWIWGAYSIAALGEESFKWIYIKKFVSWLLGEIILLGIVSGIVFGWTENLVYIIQYITQSADQETILSLIQQRWILPIIVHIGSMCITLIIGFSLKIKIPPSVARSIALIGGIGSHFLFNLSQYYNIPLWSGIIILWYLFIISYSLFRSDLLYISSEKSD